MEDAAEFYLCFMNEVFSYVKYFTDRSIDSLLSSSPFKSIGNAFYNAYVMVIKTTVRCTKCNYINTYKEQQFLLSIPISL